MSDDASTNKTPINNASVNTQFKPGQSGNPGGRPTGSRNFTTALEEELKARILVTEDKKRKKISKKEAIAKQLVNKAISGDLRAIQTLMNITRLRDSAAAQPEPASRQRTDIASLTPEAAARIYAEMLKKAQPDE